MINCIPEPPDDPAPEPPTPADDAIGPCPVCGGRMEQTPYDRSCGQATCAGECEWTFAVDTLPQLQRAAALLRACERLDAVVQRWDGEIAGSILLDDWFIEDELCLGEVQYGPLADAIIALAARVEEASDETMA